MNGTWFSTLCILLIVGRNAAVAESLRSTFEYVQFDSDARQESNSVVSMFHQAFHKCSMDEICEFVVYDVEKAMYQRYWFMEDLPASKKGLVIFRKITSLVGMSKHLLIMHAFLIGKLSYEA